MERRKTRQVFVGDVPLGGDAPIVIQSMLNAPQGDIEANILQARELSAAGCQLIRLSVTSMEDIETVKALKENIRVPIIADIQMNYKLALASIEAGIDKIRINPRYIGGEDKVRLVADACKAHKVPIRVGVNSGSVELDLLEKYGGVTPEAMAESAMRGVKYLEDVDFHDIVISIKSSDIRTMIAAYRIVAAQCDYPLHLGVTEAGTERMGRVKSSIGIGALLAIGIAKEVEERLKDVHKSIHVAVMGCPVNGPGEAKNADIGIAGGNGVGLIFAKGEVIKKVPEEELIDALMEEIEKL